MYAGTYEMPNCNACGRQVRPGELSESFGCPKCRNATIWRCEGCKGKQKKYVTSSLWSCRIAITASTISLSTIICLDMTDLSFLMSRGAMLSIVPVL